MATKKQTTEEQEQTTQSTTASGTVSLEGGPAQVSDPAPQLDYSGVSQESPNDVKLDYAKLAQSGYTLPHGDAKPKALAELNAEADKAQKASNGPTENK